MTRKMDIIDLGIMGIAGISGIFSLADYAMQAYLPRKKPKPVERAERFEETAPNEVSSIDPEEIHLDPARFQYKACARSGSTGSLDGVEKWDSDLAGLLLVWRDVWEGKLYAVNCHNRVLKARELGVSKVWIREIVANSVAQAREIGALANIAEGNGTAIDAARFLRSSGLTIADMADRGVPLSGKIARQAIALAQLEPSLFDLVLSGELSVCRGEAIAALENHQDQVAIWQKVQNRKGLTVDVLTEMVAFAGMAPTVECKQSTLFGEEIWKESLIEERAALQAAIVKRLKRQRRVFATVTQKGNTELLEEGGNVIDRDASFGMARDGGLMLDWFSQEKRLVGEVSEQLNIGAKMLREGIKQGGVENLIWQSVERLWRDRNA